MPNPLDYNSREAFQSAIEMQVDEVYTVPSSILNDLNAEYFAEVEKEEEAAAPTDDTEIHELADALGSEFDSVGTESTDDDDLDDEESAPIIQLANRVI